MNTLLLCNDCGWTGKQNDCIRKSRGLPNTDEFMETYFECPKCNSENLIELDSKGVQLELVPA